MSDFFGKLKSGAEKVAFEADKMSRLNRVKGELEKIKGQIHAQYARLGEMYYAQREAGTISGPAYDEICQEITEFEKQAEAKAEEVQRIDAEVYGAPGAQPQPPAMGQPAAPVPGQYTPPSMPVTPVTPVTQVPQATPVPVPPPPPPAAAAPKFCTNCGKELPAGVKFCPECGTTA